MNPSRGIVISLFLSSLLAGTAVGASPTPGECARGNITIEEHGRRLNLALGPVFQPLVMQWTHHRYGPEARATIRFIGLEASGTIHVHVDIEAPNRTCIFAFYYQWKDGWKLLQVDNHSGSASGCH